ncbi:MAG: ABC transporter permease [Bacteroidetes bacterium]|nr:ABC transporter permease [Bacteroidota bacterium]
MYFSQSVSNATGSLISQSNILTKVYFPRVFIPLTPVLAKLVDFSIAFLFLVLFILYYSFTGKGDFAITPNLILLPFIFIIMMISAAGFGFWLSALALQYRDVRFAVNYLLQVLIFLTPVVYSVASFNQNIVAKYGYWVKVIYALFPMSGVVEGFRTSLLGTANPQWDLLLIGSASAIFIFTTGMFYFIKTERVFADLA